MGDKDRNKENAAGPLAPEDIALWEKVAGTAKPLRKGKNRAVDLPEAPTAPEPAQTSGKSEKAESLPTQAEEEKTPRPATPPLGSFDRREVRGLSAGRASVDARIDLHGMRQREAYAAMKAFLARAQAREHRYVLVITGKGEKRAEHRPVERGILNREVPRWLGEPDFRQWVVSFTRAHKRHGGEGALYVRLRKPGRN